MLQHNCGKMLFSMTQFFMIERISQIWLKSPANNLEFWLKYIEKVLALSCCSWSYACPVAFMTLLVEYLRAGS